MKVQRSRHASSSSASDDGEPPTAAPFSLGAGIRAYYGLPIQADAVGAPTVDPGAAFAAATSSAPREVPFRAEMEGAFGRDFSHVQSFTGQGEAMGAIGARAAAQGNQVAFASDSPDRKVVAHELTHVVQQTQAGGGGLAGSSLVTGGNEPAARAPDAVGEKVARGERVEVHQPPGQGLHREPDLAHGSILGNVMRFLGHRDVVNLSQVNQELHGKTQDLPLENTQTTLRELNTSMQDHRLLGYHSAKKSYDKQLYEGLRIRHFGENTPGGQLGPGFYLFPGQGGKEHAKKYGEKDYQPYRVLGKGFDEEHVRERKEEESTWPRGKSTPPGYLHPDVDGVTDHMDSGGMKEMKLSPHTYDPDALVGAVETLGRFPFDFKWSSNEDIDVESHFHNNKEYPFNIKQDGELPKELEYEQEQLIERMNNTNVQVAPPSNPEGTLGKTFLDTIKERYYGKK
jgi:Domain of unknown function (DUF4157)